MAKRQRRGNKPNGKGRTRDPVARFIQIPYYMLESAAWQTLEPGAWKTFFAIRCQYNGKNNTGEIFLSCDDGAELLDMGRSTVHRHLKTLEDRGFLTCNERGYAVKTPTVSDDGEVVPVTRFATTYWLNDVPRNKSDGTEILGGASNEFMRWRPKPDEPPRRSKSGAVIQFPVPLVGRRRPAGGTGQA